MKKGHKPKSPVPKLCFEFFARVLPVFRHQILFMMLLMPGAGVPAEEGIPDTIAQRALACTACHGKEGHTTNDGYFPRIAGKPAGYLYNQLRNFRDGRRQYPPMTGMVAYLSDAYLKELADYFAGLKLPYPPAVASHASEIQMERGRELMFNGDQGKNIPACVACHGKSLAGVAPAIPALIGLPHDYLNAQFGAWRDHTRHAAAPDCMAQIIARLSQEDINAASAWLAAQAVTQGSEPEQAPSGKLPMSCGSLTQ